jgi:hypothetical protein
MYSVNGGLKSVNGEGSLRRMKKTNDRKSLGRREGTACIFRKNKLLAVVFYPSLESGIDVFSIIVKCVNIDTGIGKRDSAHPRGVPSNQLFCTLIVSQVKEFWKQGASIAGRGAARTVVSCSCYWRLHGTRRDELDEQVGSHERLVAQHDECDVGCRRKGGNPFSDGRRDPFPPLRVLDNLHRQIVQLAFHSIRFKPEDGEDIRRVSSQRSPGRPAQECLTLVLEQLLGRSHAGRSAGSENDDGR